MRIVDLGLVPYTEALRIQGERVEEVAAGAEETLYLLEHPPVITVGKGGGLDNLHVTEAFLRERGVDVVHIRRGGNITCHFPGQLVAYPVFRIRAARGGVRGFFHDMEEVVIRVLNGYGLQPGRVEGRPGVWMDGRRKVASMGIGVRRWVTFHGLSLNVEKDMNLFSLITPCGLSDIEPTSIHAELGRLGAGSGAAALPDMKEVKDAVAKKFREVFAHPGVAEDQASG